MFTCVMSSPIEITCPALRNPSNGTVTYAKVFPRSIAVYKCNKGFRLSDSGNRRMCTDNGIWNKFEPMCKRIMLI